MHIKTHMHVQASIRHTVALHYVLMQTSEVNSLLKQQPLHNK